MKRACHKNEEAQDINDWENDCLTNIVQGCPIKYHSVKLQTEKCPYCTYMPAMTKRQHKKRGKTL